MTKINHENGFGFLGLVLRQRFIERWSWKRRAEPESVLEHSAIVALLALLAGEIAGKKQGRTVDFGVLLAHALLHDTAEVLCSDVVSPVKTANPVLAREFTALEREAETRLIATLPSWLETAMARAFDPGGYEQALVKACDVYAAVIKCRLEVAAGNGVEFESAREKLQSLFDRLKPDFPELDALDRLFGTGVGSSVDDLLARPDRQTLRGGTPTRRGGSIEWIGSKSILPENRLARILADRSARTPAPTLPGNGAERPSPRHASME